MGCRLIGMMLTAKCKEQDYTSFEEKAGNFWGRSGLRKVVMDERRTLIHREERMRRMRVVKARPNGWEKVKYWGESTLL
jgi:hypothetical protein